MCEGGCKDCKCHEGGCAKCREKKRQHQRLLSDNYDRSEVSAKKVFSKAAEKF